MDVYTKANCHCLMRWQFILTYLLFNCYGEISNSFIVTVIRLNAAYGIVLYQSTVCDYHCNEFSLREHLTVNQGVVGSSPTGGAKLTKSETKAYRRWFRISFAFRRLAMIRHCVWHLARSPPICPFDIDANT